MVGVVGAVAAGRRNGTPGRSHSSPSAETDRLRHSTDCSPFAQTHTNKRHNPNVSHPGLHPNLRQIRLTNAGAFFVFPFHFFANSSFRFFSVTKRTEARKHWQTSNKPMHQESKQFLYLKETHNHRVHAMSPFGFPQILSVPGSNTVAELTAMATEAFGVQLVSARLLGLPPLQIRSSVRVHGATRIAELDLRGADPLRVRLIGTDAGVHARTVRCEVDAQERDQCQIEFDAFLHNHLTYRGLFDQASELWNGIKYRVQEKMVAAAAAAQKESPDDALNSLDDCALRFEHIAQAEVDSVEGNLIAEARDLFLRVRSVPLGHGFCMLSDSAAAALRLTHPSARASDIDIGDCKD